MVPQEEESSADAVPCAAFCREWNTSLAAALQDADLLGQLRLLADKGMHPTCNTPPLLLTTFLVMSAISTLQKASSCRTIMRSNSAVALETREEQA